MCVLINNVTDVSIAQVATLEDAHRLHPSARWWVKADGCDLDGCDLVSGLEESLRCEWNGDVDLDTGELQQLYNSYLNRLKRIASILTSISQDTLKALKEEEDDITDDILFVSKGI